nr:uncharacterized protein CTRU02_10303 [Colletotrichum truncatum]KAF6787507.1 hypothetical protein CTRU02_10303 [Colletotrichum truncatum]
MASGNRNRTGRIYARKPGSGLSRPKKQKSERQPSPGAQSMVPTQYGVPLAANTAPIMSQTNPSTSSAVDLHYNPTIRPDAINVTPSHIHQHPDESRQDSNSLPTLANPPPAFDGLGVQMPSPQPGQQRDVPGPVKAPEFAHQSVDQTVDAPANESNLDWADNYGGRDSETGRPVPHQQILNYMETLFARPVNHIFTHSMKDAIRRILGEELDSTTVHNSNASPYKRISQHYIKGVKTVEESLLWAFVIRAVALPEYSPLANLFKKSNKKPMFMAMARIVAALYEGRAIPASWVEEAFGVMDPQITYESPMTLGFFAQQNVRQPATSKGIQQFIPPVNHSAQQQVQYLAQPNNVQYFSQQSASPSGSVQLSSPSPSAQQQIQHPARPSDVQQAARSSGVARSVRPAVLTSYIQTGRQQLGTATIVQSPDISRSIHQSTPRPHQTAVSGQRRDLPGPFVSDGSDFSQYVSSEQNTGSSHVNMWHNVFGRSLVGKGQSNAGADLSVVATQCSGDEDDDDESSVLTDDHETDGGSFTLEERKAMISTVMDRSSQIPLKHRNDIVTGWLLEKLMDAGIDVADGTTSRNNRLLKRDKLD